MGIGCKEIPDIPTWYPLGSIYHAGADIWHTGYMLQKAKIFIPDND
jgi:hypothetical protein